ncbi:MAG: 1-deoxy-D-xylulose-5-phosphate reductoisomerase [Bacilli bacterium]|nr:1-deoxy-D-xylulose-5-phosphate reductoisomerase [Bacilli bacterium]
MKKIALLGCTGSVGRSTLDVIREHSDLFQAVAMAAGENLEEFVLQIMEFQPALVSMKTADLAQELKARLTGNRGSYEFRMPEIVYGEQGLISVAVHPDADIVLTAVVGVQGLKPTLAAVQAGKDIALANKETLVAAGHLVQQAAGRSGSSILPVDSEHSAIFQCLNGKRTSDVSRLILTSSGGPFRTKSRQELARVTAEDALKHPTWSMGAKITIDSATLMNKGLEVIEAHWLFDVPFTQIDVLVHPQSIVHSLVEFLDGSLIAQLGTTDMRLPIQYALSYPNRLPTERSRLNLAEVGTLTFQEPDMVRFPCLSLCYQAGSAGGTAPVVINAANEVANALFLAGKLPFLGIEKVLDQVLDRHQMATAPDLDEVLASDEWARRTAFELAAELD